MAVVFHITYDGGNIAFLNRPIFTSGFIIKIVSSADPFYYLKSALSYYLTYLSGFTLRILSLWPNTSHAPTLSLRAAFLNTSQYRLPSWADLRSTDPPILFGIRTADSLFLEPRVRDPLTVLVR